MKYDEVVRIAAERELPEKPGPSFDALLAAGAVGAATGAGGKTAWAWIVATIGGVAVAGGAVALFVGGAPTNKDETSDAAAGPQRSPAVELAPRGVQDRVPEEERIVAPKRETAGREGVEARIEEPASEEELETGTRPASKAPAAPRDPEQLYREAEDALASGKLADARRRLTQIVRKHKGWSGHATAMIELARIEKRAGRGKRAVCAYRAFLHRYPMDALAGEATRALEGLEGANAVSPDDCP